MGGLFLQLIVGLLLIIVGFIGMAVTTGAIRMALRQRRLDTRGVETTGTVIRHREAAPNSFFTYRIEVDGKSYTHEEAVGGDVTEQPPIGSTVTVRYLAENPKFNAMAGETAYSRVYRTVRMPLMVMATVVFLVIGLAGMWLIVSLPRA